MLRVVSLNFNGIRAAFRKGAGEWLAEHRPDIVCVQELKAQQKDLTDEMLAPGGLTGYFSCAERPGYSGVGVYSRREPSAVVPAFGSDEIDSEGRFMRLDFPACSFISLYMPSGSSSGERQRFKYGVMAQVYDRMAAYRADAGREYIICADWNIAHTRKDIRNWRGNQNNSGFLPEERAWMSSLLDGDGDSGGLGWVDAFRRINSDDDEFTWWSSRGKAWLNNVGWRIDYQLATPGIAACAAAASIYRAQRFSDHAPLTIDYRCAGGGGAEAL